MPSKARPEAEASRVVTILLAAGEGRRMGGPKALIEIHGLTLVRRLIRVARFGGIASVVVVVGAEARRVSAEATAEHATVVENADWSRGQTSSLKAALRFLPRELDAFVIHPVDHAFTTADDFRRILGCFLEASAPRSTVVRPVHAGLDFGHPVLFGSSFRDEFLALADHEPASIVYQRARAKDQVLLAAVTNPLIARDLDTPADLSLLARLDPLDVP